MNTTPLFGIDLGGTKIEGVALDPSEPTKPICRVRISTDPSHRYEKILDQISELVAQMIRAAGVTPLAIGIGHPGTLDPISKRLKNSNTTSLNNMPLHADLEKRLGLSVRMANDANCFVLAESRWGAAKDRSMVFGVILGTGVGGGIAYNKAVRHGLQGIAGEWGHNVLDPSGPPCYCGKNGCVETIISGPALEQYYYEHSGKRCALHELTALSSHDPHAAATLERLYRYFAQAISVVINIMDPDMVVLGGGVSNLLGLYEHGVSQVKNYIFNDRCETPIVRNLLGDSAGVFGAALMAAEIV